MEYRFLGASGLEVSALSFGTMTLGGEGRFAAMGNVQVDEARRLGRIKRGDYTLLVAFGAGLTYGSALIRW